MTPPPLRHAALAAAAGGVLGALARYGLTVAWPVGAGYPWTFFVINVLGSGLLAAVPAVPAVRRKPWLGVFLGTGILGGFTTMSTAATGTVVLLDHGRGTTAVLYAVGTLLASLTVVALISSRVRPADRLAAERDEVDE